MGPGANQPVLQLRVARHTERLQQVVGFYRDGIGLPEIGGFHNHHGYDGVFLAVPGTGAHLELTAGGGHDAPMPHPDALLVLYLRDDAAVRLCLYCVALDQPAPRPTRHRAGRGRLVLRKAVRRARP